MSAPSLSCVLVGCGRMGSNQAKVIASLDGYRLVAVCDVNEENARRVAAEMSVKAYGDFSEALARERPDVAAICTGNTTHAPLTIAAARSGVKGVYCEKPMATCMKDAREMVAACDDAGALLVINHQRRLGGDLVRMRQLIDSGAIGDVHVFRGECAGDILSDGTHLIDSLMWLAGDEDVEWVLGQVHRDMKELTERASDGVPPGYRYGHVIESGGSAAIGLASGRRLEIHCGDMRRQYRAYQDYEISGTLGRLWRCGDRAVPNVFVQDALPGTWQTGMDDWTLKPVPCDDDLPGQWRPVDSPALFEGSAIAEGYRRLAGSLRDGSPHPMDGHTALRGFEVVMGIYESARTSTRVVPPLNQDRFPLELMVEEAAG